MSTLTPVPWNVDDGYGTSVERDAEGVRYHIADCVDRKHARHIVRCVNAHDDLQAAAKFALLAINKQRRMTEARALLVAALAKA